MIPVPVLAFVLAVGLQPPGEAPTPTVIERGLLDRACRDSASDVEKCREDQLAAIRTDFGKDLAKVKPDDRKKVDTACSPLLADTALKGRGPYFDCVFDQLTAIRNSRRKNASAAAPAAGAPSDAPAEAAAEVPAPQPAGTSTARVVGGAVAAVALLGGIAFVVMRSRGPKMRKCQGCGALTADSDMCANCRRAAAEAIRAAKTEQAEQARRAAEEAKREEANQAKRREMQRQREEEARKVREYDEQREREHAAKVAEAVRPNEPDLPPPPSPFDPEAFDPHAILGIAPGASADAIKAAYDAAKKKYDPELVGHLSEEVQAHYREKSAAVDKAFATLTGSQPA